MYLERATAVLEKNYQPFETGFRRISPVQMEVAALHYLPAVKGEMIRWWLENLDTSEQYRKWHPIKNLDMVWLDRPDGASFLGSTMQIRQEFGGHVWEYRVSYHDTSEVVDPRALRDSGASFAYMARYGALNAPFWVGKSLTVCRDLPDGCEIRSHYWLGDSGMMDLGPDADTLSKIIDDDFASSLLAYNIEAMRHLASFLPQLYSQCYERDTNSE